MDVAASGKEVVLVPKYYFPTYGGLQNFTYRLGRALLGLGLRVSIVYPDIEPYASTGIEPRSCGIREVALSASRGRFWKQVVVELERSEGTRTVLMIGLEYDAFVDLQLDAVEALAAQGNSVFLRVATSYDFEERIGASRGERFAHLRGLICLNRQMQAEASRVPQLDGKVALIPNFVDPNAYRPPTPEERRRAREALGIAPLEFVVLWTGRINERKRLDDALTAWLEAAVPGKLLIVGNPDTDFGHSRLHELLLAHEGAIMHHMAVAEHRMPAFYWAADCLLLTSLREGMSNAVIEAVCCRLPVVAYHIPGVVEIGDLHAPAVISSCEPGNIMELARCLRAMAANPQRPTFGDHVWSGEVAAFSEEHIVGRYVEFLELG